VVVAALADGAGGTSLGAEAASTVVECVRAAAASEPWLLDAQTWGRVLLDCDARLERAGGQATGVIVASDGVRLAGASVGDSEAWVVDSLAVDQVTDGQPRKPLLGARCGMPKRFAFELTPTATIVLGSDGVFARVARERWLAVLRSPQTAEACGDALLEAARLPSGTWADDASVVVLRALRQSEGRSQGA
jgi:PPM family protein phosphatase